MLTHSKKSVLLIIHTTHDLSLDISHMRNTVDMIEISPSDRSLSQVLTLYTFIALSDIHEKKGGAI
jgi:phosphopantetheinyl transferase